MTPLQSFAIFAGSIVLGGLWAIVGWQFTSAAYAIGFAATLIMGFCVVFFTKQTVGLIRRGLSWLQRTGKSLRESQVLLSQSRQDGP